MSALLSFLKRPAVVAAVLWLCLAGYAVLLFQHAGAQPGGSDSSGYFNLARLFLQGKTGTDMRAVPGLPPRDIHGYAYVPLGFRPDPTSTRLEPTYPIGLPLFFALGIGLCGTAAGGNLVMIAHALAGLWLTHRLSRQLGCTQATAFLAAAALALSPLYLMNSLYAMSDMPSLVWITAAVLLADRARADGRNAYGAGFAIGVAVLLRPTNLLLVLPVLFAVDFSPRLLLRVAAGGLPGALLLGAFNHSAYGSALASGYGGVGDLLAWSWVPVTLAHYAQWLPFAASPLLVVFPGVLGLWRTARRTVLVLGTWIAADLGFYAFYFHTHETWWYLRFALPCVPAFLIGAALGVERFAGAGWRRPLAATLLAVVLASGLYWSRALYVLDIGRNDDVYRNLGRWARTVIPPDAPILCMQGSGALHYYGSQPLLRWDMVGDQWPRIRAVLQKSTTPVYAVLFPFEEHEALQVKIPGPWKPVGRIGPAGLWQLEPAAP